MIHWLAKIDVDEDSIRIGYIGIEAGFAVIAEDNPENDLGVYMTIEDVKERISTLFGLVDSFTWLA